MNRMSRWANVLASVAVFLCVGPAYAQATRTWVSGVGDDANPCSRTAPCKTFAGAISKTATGGEINVLDPGSYGAVTITKSISIEADGALAGVLVSGTNGIVVNGSGVVVTLRGLTMEGAGAGLTGIRFLSGSALYVEDCTIQGFTQGAISFEPAANAQLFVRNTVIKNNRGAFSGGVRVKPGAAATAFASFDRVSLLTNQYGLWVDNRGSAALHDSVASGNLTAGVNAYTTSGGPATILVSQSQIAGNGTAGVAANGAGAEVRLAKSSITANALGLWMNAGGTILSFGDNALYGNPGGDGSPSTTWGNQ